MKDKIYFKEAKDQYLRKFGLKSSLSAIYGVFVILILLLAWVWLPSLILSVPLILLPLTFGYIGANSSINSNLKMPYRIMFSLFARYYRDALFGCFRSLFGLIKAVVVYMIYSTLISIVVVSVLSVTSQEFINLIHEIEGVTTIEGLQEIITKIELLPEYILGLYISFTVSFGFAVYAFIHHIFTNSIKYCMVFSAPKPIGYREINYMHRIGFRKFRKNFYLNYYLVATLIATLYIAGYAGGSLISYFIFKMDYVQSAAIGLFGGFALNLFLLPLLFDVIEAVYKHEGACYVQAFAEKMTRAFDELKNSSELNDEEKAKMQKVIEDVNKELENNKDKDATDSKND